MKNSDLKRFFETDASNNNEGFARLNTTGALNAPVSSSKISTGNAADGMLMAADGEGGVKFVEQGGGGTTVVANPTLAGTEGFLTGIQVGDTKYKVQMFDDIEVAAKDFSNILSLFEYILTHQDITVDKRFIVKDGQIVDDLEHIFTNLPSVAAAFLNGCVGASEKSFMLFDLCGAKYVDDTASSRHYVTVPLQFNLGFETESETTTAVVTYSSDIESISKICGTIYIHYQQAQE